VHLPLNSVDVNGRITYKLISDSYMALLDASY